MLMRGCYSLVAARLSNQFWEFDARRFQASAKRSAARASAVGFALLAVLFLAFSPLGYAATSLEENRLLAQLVPQRFTTLSAELPARVEQIAIREGERFARGDTLVQLDCELQSAQQDRASAQLRAAQASHRANQELQRLAAVGQLEFAESAAAQAVAEAELRYLDVTLDKCLILAPWDGAAGQWHTRPGSYVQAGQPVLDIHDTESLQVEFIVPTAWLSWFKPGYAFELYVEELDRNIALRLRNTAARADPVSQSVKAVADLEAPHEDLIAGMSGYLQLSPPVTNATARDN